jgi:cytochrome c-type biogenesis protein CcmH/NrfG
MYFQNCIQLSPQTVSYKELGRVYLLTGDLGNALDVYKKAVK